MKYKTNLNEEIKYGVDEDGNKVRIYSKAEQKEIINQNQDVIFHNKGWLISHTAGH